MEVPITTSSRTSALLNAGKVRSGDVIDTDDIVTFGNVPSIILNLKLNSPLFPTLVSSNRIKILMDPIVLNVNVFPLTVPLEFEDVMV